MTLNQETSLRELDAAIIREAADVLQAIGTSGVNLPENWRWPLIDELAGISAALAARAEPQAGEWVLVPREATEEMFDAWLTAHCVYDPENQHFVMHGDIGNWRYNYALMLAAAPSPPATAGQENT